MNPRLTPLRHAVAAALERGLRADDGQLTALAPADHAALSETLGRLTLADFAGWDQLPSAATGWREVEVFALDGARASLFVVPPGSALPLHDHPGMTVFLRTLAGRLHIRSFDWEPAAGPGLAREITALATTPGDAACVLLPDRGNLHAIASEAGGGSAVFLDLFLPYYDDLARPCTCYREVEGVAWRGERLVRLVAAPELDPEFDRG